MNDSINFFPLDNVRFIEDNSLNRIDIGIKIDDEISILEEDIYLFYPNAFFKISGANTVYFRKTNVLNETEFKIQLLTSVYTAILFQRGIFPLHASSFVYQGAGVVVCGDSGVGKSSILTAFCQDGSKLLNDDITPIIIDKGDPKIVQTNTKTKLWTDSLSHFSIPVDNLEPVIVKMDKYFVPLDRYKKKSADISIIVMLSGGHQNEFLFEELNASEKFMAIHQQLFRIRYLKGLPSVREVFFNQVVEIAKKTIVLKLERPWNASIDQTYSFLQHKINEIYF